MQRLALTDRLAAKALERVVDESLLQIGSPIRGGLAAKLLQLSDLAPGFWSPLESMVDGYLQEVNSS